VICRGFESTGHLACTSHEAGREEREAREVREGILGISRNRLSIDALHSQDPTRRPEGRRPVRRMRLRGWPRRVSRGGRRGDPGNTSPSRSRRTCVSRIASLLPAPAGGRRVASPYQIIEQDVAKRISSGPISAALLFRVGFDSAGCFDGPTTPREDIGAQPSRHDSSQALTRTDSGHVFFANFAVFATIVIRPSAGEPRY
jgi:hypothetical protein